MRRPQIHLNFGQKKDWTRGAAAKPDKIRTVKQFLLHAAINEKKKQKYPTLTRGIINKGGEGSNGIYNQDLNPNIILIEIGAQENTIDEVLNTIDLLAPIIGEYINET